MKRIVVTVVLPAIMYILFNGCEPSAITPPDAQFYFINASPDSQGLDFFLDDALLSDNLLYGEDTGYFRTSPGLHHLMLKKTGTTRFLINVNMSLTAAQPYSIFAIDSASKLKPSAVADSTSAPAGDTAKIRLLNFCINSPSLITEFMIDTVVKLRYSSRIFNDQNADPSQALFRKIGANIYTLNIKKSRDSSSVASFSNIELEKGKIYTIYLKGSYDSTNTNSLDKGIIQHN